MQTKGLEMYFDKQRSLAFTKGEEIYFLENYTDMVVKGKILDFYIFNEEKNEVYADIRELSCPGRLNVKIDCIFKTEEEAINYKKEKDEKLKNQYRSQIQTIKDLALFMYFHTVACCEEYTDWNAREVAKEKFKELLDVDLDSENNL